MVRFLVLFISVFAYAENSDLKNVFLLTEGRSLNERIDILTNHFLDKPFIDYPLGEGQMYDERPRWRIDGFDCATFVETIAALALSPDLGEFEETVIKVRYMNNEPTFETRAHFPDADWNKNLISRGLAQDITEKIGLNQSKIYRYEINRRGWYEKLSIERTFPSSPAKLSILRSLGSKYGVEPVEVPYIPITSIVTPDPNGNISLKDYDPRRPDKRFKVNQALLDRIPSGAVFGLLRPQQMDPKIFGTKQVISHRGFVLREKNLKWRHMTIFKRRSIESEMIKELIFRLEDSDLLGIQFLELQG